jgi:2-oxopent-4-enoate/cis-2-oxohex-4-enoate hydratase
VSLNPETTGDALYACLRTRQTMAPLTEGAADVTIDDAYAISTRMLRLREADGEKLVGKKIGVTGLVVQQMLDVHQPDFGYLTDAMWIEAGQPVPISTRLIQPRAEGEVAFVLSADMQGPGVTPADVLAATRSVAPCFEIVDSRIDAWRIKIQDTVADNASSGLFVIGQPVSPEGLDLSRIQMQVTKNGAPLSEGKGDASALGSPEACVAWLANTLGAYGIPLRAGEVILSGSLVPLEPVVAGDTMRVEISGLGALEVDFS